MITFVPQYLIKNGIRIDYDIRLKSRHWLQVAPQFYLREHAPSSPGDHAYDFNKLAGTGLHLYHRYYPGGGPGKDGVYISYGLTWQYFHLLYDEKILTNSIERYAHIHKWGGEVNIGLIALLTDHLIFDIYAGLGTRHAFMRSDADKARQFNGLFTDYGYSGNLINLGIRIGILR